MGATFWYSLLRTMLVIIAAVFIFVGTYFVIPLIYPFILGILFALIVNPLVDLLQRKAKFPRWLSVSLAILLLLTVLSVLVTLIVVEVASEIKTLSETLPQVIENYITLIQDFVMNDVVAFYDQFTDFYSSLDPELQRNIQSQVQDFTDQLAQIGKNAAQSIAEGILSFIGSIPNMATAFIISLLASFFISKDWPRWQSTVGRFLPDTFQSRSMAVLKDLRKALFGFGKAQLTLISITFVIVLIGFFILRIEYALTLALILAVVDLLPYLGTGLVFVPWIVYLFINGDYSLVIGLSILYGIVLVQRQMMEPKILGTNVGLDPLLTLVALFVGFQLFGLIGLIIGPVSMVIIGALYRAGVFKDLWMFIRGEE